MKTQIGAVVVGERRIRPLQLLKSLSDRTRKFRADKSGIVAAVILLVLILFSVVGPFVWSHEANILTGEYLAAPSLEHPAGTDSVGRDTLSRLMNGGRISFLAATGAGAIGLFVGFPLGLISGYRGGILDSIVMRFVDTLYAFPTILLVLAVVAALGPGLDKLIIGLGAWGIPTITRLARGQALAVRETDYVDAARGLGGGELHILFRHMAPNVASPILIQVSLMMSAAVLIEASLGFLGAGVAPPTATWGGMLLEAFPAIRRNAFQTVMPGILIFLLVASLNMVGDAVRDVRDPKLRNTNMN